MIADALPGDVNIDSLVFDPTTGTFVERTEPSVAYTAKQPPVTEPFYSDPTELGRAMAEAVDRVRKESWYGDMLRAKGLVVDEPRQDQAGIAARLAALDEIPEPDDFEHYVRSVTDELAELLLQKHHDYGPYNIAASPGGALNGIRVRLHDKFARLNNLIDSGRLPRNESIRDTWVDIAGYAVIALLVSDDRWPA